MYLQEEIKTPSCSSSGHIGRDTLVEAADAFLLEYDTECMAKARVLGPLRLPIVNSESDGWNSRLTTGNLSYEL